MEKTNYISPFLKIDFWVSHLEKLYGKPASLNRRKIDIVEPLRSLFSYYSWNSFVIGFFQSEDRKRPLFYILYKPVPTEKGYIFKYFLDFENINIFMDFLEAIKNPSLLPLCINFEPANEIISAALKDLC